MASDGKSMKLGKLCDFEKGTNESRPRQAVLPFSTVTGPVTERNALSSPQTVIISRR